MDSGSQSETYAIPDSVYIVEINPNLWEKNNSVQQIV